MRTLDRYVLREWTKVFLVSALGVPLVPIIFDLTDNLDKYMSRGLHKGAIFLAYVYALPETIYLVIPAAVLIATVFTVGAMGRHSEITAAKASGVSFHRLVRPLLAASLGAFVFGLILGEIAPVATQRRAQLLGDELVRSQSSRYNFVYRADGGWVYAIGSLFIVPRQMRDLMLEREGAGPEYPTIVVSAPVAQYTDSLHRWSLVHGTLRYLLGPGEEMAFGFDTLRTRSLKETPTDLLAQPKAPEEMRYAELGRYIDALSRSGSDAKKLRVKQALKIAIPFASVIIAFFGAPLAITNPRAGAAYGIALSLGVTIIFLLLIQLSQAIGAGGVVPPLLAAWLPNLGFGAAALWLLKKAPT
jgi:lipopolysaccharide export system permease protein